MAIFWTQIRVKFVIFNDNSHTWDSRFFFFSWEIHDWTILETTITLTILGKWIIVQIFPLLSMTVGTLTILRRSHMAYQQYQNIHLPVRVGNEHIHYTYLSGIGHFNFIHDTAALHTEGISCHRLKKFSIKIFNTYLFINYKDWKISKTSVCVYAIPTLKLKWWIEFLWATFFQLLRVTWDAKLDTKH